MNDLEKLKRHLSKPIPVKLKNIDGVEDVFYFKPLNISQQSIMMQLSKNLQSRKEIEVDGKKVPDITKEDMEEMELLLTDVVKESFEGIGDKELKDFVNSNFTQLSDILIDLIPQVKDNKALALIKSKMGSKLNESS